MGMHIVTWPGEIAPVPGSSRLPRQRLQDDDLLHNASRLTEEALDAVLSGVEEAHADALSHRRRNLLLGASEAAQAAGRQVAEQDQSLEIMRARMLEETDPAAAVFIGGMEGISDEFAMFRERFPDRPVYPLGNPGGEARSLLEKADSPLRKELAESDVYPTLMRKVVEDLARHLER